MISSCPICRSSKIEALICGRCKADLSLVAVLLKNKQVLLQQCRSEILVGDLQKAGQLTIKLSQLQAMSFHALLGKFVDYLMCKTSMQGAWGDGLCTCYYFPSPYPLASSLRGRVILLGYDKN